MRRAKRLFFDSISVGSKGIKGFWSMIRSVSREERGVPSVLHNGSMTAESPVARATLLNEHFVTYFTNVASTTESAVPLSQDHCQLCQMLAMRKEMFWTWNVMNE